MIEVWVKGFCWPATGAYNVRVVSFVMGWGGERYRKRNTRCITVVSCCARSITVGRGGNSLVCPPPMILSVTIFILLNTDSGLE